jgi:hypothetical protein
MQVSGWRHAPAELYPRGKDPLVTVGQEAEWDPESVWTQTRGIISLPLPGIEPPSSSPDAILTELPQLPINKCIFCNKGSCSL